MPNSNYIKGRKKEYKIVKEFRDKGYDIVQRTAGSRSPFDVIAIRKEDNRITLIQVKPNNISQGQVDKIYKDNDWLDTVYRCEFIVK